MGIGQTGEKHHRWSRVEKTCRWCDKLFEANASYAPDAKYCSYDCFQLKTRDGQPVYKTKICESYGCAVGFTTAWNSDRRFCSIGCSRSGKRSNWHGKPGTQTGTEPWSKGLTKNDDPRIRKMGKKISKVISEQFAGGQRNHRGKNNPAWGRTPDTRTIEQLNNYSQAAIRRIQEGKSGFLLNKRGRYFSKKMNKEMIYRSQWELRTMKILDADVNVRAYDYETVVIRHDGTRRYIVDFDVYYSNGIRELIEVKEKKSVNDENVIRKANTARLYCEGRNMRYCFWTEDEIGEHEQRLEIA